MTADKTIPIQFVFNTYNYQTLGTYERELSTDVDFISVYIDAIALSYENTEENLITQICYTIEHEIWHYLMKDMGISTDQEHDLIYRLMADKPMGEMKSNLGEVLDKKRAEIEQKINIAYG